MTGGLCCFSQSSLRAEETSQEKLAAHKAAGGRETQQYPVPTGSDLSNASGARDVRRKSYRCSRPVLLYHNAAMFHKKRVHYETR